MTVGIVFANALLSLSTPLPPTASAVTIKSVIAASDEHCDYIVEQAAYAYGLFA